MAKKDNKTIWIILAIIILLAFLALGIYFGTMVDVRADYQPVQYKFITSPLFIEEFPDCNANFVVESDLFSLRLDNCKIDKVSGDEYWCVCSNEVI